MALCEMTMYMGMNIPSQGSLCGKISDSRSIALAPPVRHLWLYGMTQANFLYIVEN